MRYLILCLLFVLTGCAGYRKTPLCRHTVLAQYAAYKDAGYDTEIWHMRNNHPVRFKYHVALRVRPNNTYAWEWVVQRKTTYTTTDIQPHDTVFHRRMTVQELVNWIGKSSKGIK